MKDINFINAIPPMREREVRLWFLGSSLLAAGLLIIGTSLITLRIRTALQLKKEIKRIQPQTSNFDTLITQQHTHNQQEQALKKQLEKINRWRNSPQNPHRYLMTLNQACSESIKLESLTIDKKNIEFTAHCSRADQATQMVKTLSQSPHFTALKLISLHTGHRAGLLFAVRGTIQL